MTNLNSTEKLKSIRAIMKRMAIDALIIPNADPHFSEYIPTHWKSLRWLTGFTGSAATLAITIDKAALWTDARYFIQAELQLKNLPVDLMKLNIKDTDSIETWLLKNLADGACVGIDGHLFSVQQYICLEQQLSRLNLKLIADPFDSVWHDRPTLPQSKAFLLPNSLTGNSIKEKLEVVKETAHLSQSMYVVTALDEIAWLLNMRGADIKCNPVVLAYLVIDYPTINLFVEPNQLDQEIKNALQTNDVQIHDYKSFDNFLKTINSEQKIQINPNKLSIHHYRQLNQAQVLDETDPFGVITTLKACKNETELAGFRRAMLVDGVALLRFWKWLEANIGAAHISEISAARKLHRLRTLCPDFVSDSFTTIAAYGANGALPHYKPDMTDGANLACDTFFLLDSGAQYFYGTTDITRTVHFGTPTPEEKEDYTLVLKGMIALSRAKFLAGTRGSQLDVLARQYLWARAKNYLHGTGHGVGHFLNVHEGPQSIRMEDNGVSLKPGMVVSNEPAIYHTGRYGIRIENILACQPYMSTAFGEYYQFETLTLYPIDTKAIDVQMLTKDELQWINDYHQQVFTALSPLVTEDERSYLSIKTKKIQL